MSENISPDDEDTISVPVISEGPPEEKAETDELFRTALDMAEVVSALESVGRVITSLVAEFDRMRKLVEGEDGAVTHAPPFGEDGLTPCCGRPILDVPITERISFDGAGVTCKGMAG